MKQGDRVRKRGQSSLGTVEKVVPLGIRVRWDDGVQPKTRPLLCSAQELELVSSGIS